MAAAMKESVAAGDPGHVEASSTTGTSPPLPEQETAFADYCAELEPGEREATLKRLRAFLVASIPVDELETTDLLDPAKKQIEPLALDFETPPESPRYVVDRLLERQTVNVLSGDTGAGKSMVASALAVAAARSEEWLGRKVLGSRVLIVDEENPARLVRSRLRAMGMRNDDRDSLAYFNRAGIQIGEDEWTQWLLRDARAHQADLVVIDSAMAATTPDVNENDEVVELFTKALRPIATELDLAILLLHHERKRQQGHSGGSGQAMMGARQWAGQADTHIALKVAGELEEDVESDGTRKLRREFVMERPKLRDGEPNYKERIVIESSKDVSDALDWMKVVSEGRIKKTQKLEGVVEEVVQLLNKKGESMTTGEIARALGFNSDSGTFKRALDIARDKKLVQYPKRGVYSPLEGGLDVV